MLNRYVPPCVGDTHRIQPLVNGDKIVQIEGYHCLPLYNFETQSIEVYVTQSIGGSHELIGKLHTNIPNKDFANYSVTITTAGDRVGEPSINGILQLQLIKQPLMETIRYPTRGDLRLVVESRIRAVAMWKEVRKK